jgi:hypothetical protein
METLNAVFGWVYQALATWYVAAILAAGLILFMERRDRLREPTEADVKRAAERYVEFYGSDAFSVIGDHMLAATFAPDGRHRAFLKRVSAALLSSDAKPSGQAVDDQSTS